MSSRRPSLLPLLLVLLLAFMGYRLWQRRGDPGPAPQQLGAVSVLPAQELNSGDTLTLRINHLVASRQWAPLEPLLRQFLELHPRDGQAAALLGKTLANLQKPAEALQWLERARDNGAPDADLGQWIDAQRRLAAEETELGKVRSTHFELLTEGGRAWHASDTVLQALEQAYDQLCLFWNYYPPRPLPVVLHASRAAIGPGLPDWTGALFDGKVRLPADLLDGWPRHQNVLLHELSHAFVHEMVPRRLPTWLDEGLAQHIDGTRLDPSALQGKAIPTPEILTGDFLQHSSREDALVLYQWSLALVQYLLAQPDGLNQVKALLAALGKGEDCTSGLQRYFQTDLPGLLRALQERHGLSANPAARALFALLIA